MVLAARASHQTVMIGWLGRAPGVEIPNFEDGAHSINVVNVGSE
jgi:hypothetical protein